MPSEKPLGGEEILRAVRLGKLTPAEAIEHADKLAEDSCSACYMSEPHKCVAHAEDRTTLDVPPLPTPQVANLWNVGHYHEPITGIRRDKFIWQAPIKAATEGELVCLLGHGIAALGEDGLHKLTRWLEEFAAVYGVEATAADCAAVELADVGDLSPVPCEQCSTGFTPDFEGQSLCSDECMRASSEEAEQVTTFQRCQLGKSEVSDA